MRIGYIQCAECSRNGMSLNWSSCDKHDPKFTKHYLKAIAVQWPCCRGWLDQTRSNSQESQNNILRVDVAARLSSRIQVEHHGPARNARNIAMALWLKSVPFLWSGVISGLFRGWSELDRRVVRTGPKSGPNWTARQSELERETGKMGAVRTGPRFLCFQKQSTFHAPERKSQFGPPKVVRTGPLRKSWVAQPPRIT